MISFFPSRTVALELFGLSVHWYGLMYLFSFLLALPVLPRIQKYRDIYLTKDGWYMVVTKVIIGVIVGGRLGYVLFYEPVYFFHHPIEIFTLWQGGMSSHGGFIAVILGLFYACRKLKVPFFALGDVAVVCVAIGLGLVRFGNFINQELYGTVTTLPWGISIPGVEGLRHPTQLYAVLKDFFIAGVCYWHLRTVRPIRPGSTAVVFLMLYTILRFLVEFLRVQTHPPVDLGIIVLTRGQFLNLGILAFAIWLWWMVRRGKYI